MKGCFICDAIAASPENDRENLLLVRDARAVIVVNRYPYTVGALMVAPIEHLGAINQVDDATLMDMMRLVKGGMALLDRALKPQGYNIGINQGIAAGAGLSEHLHIHVVPRWDADVNFMTAVAETRVLAEEPEHMFDKLKRAMQGDS